MLLYLVGHSSEQDIFERRPTTDDGRLVYPSIILLYHHIVSTPNATATGPHEQMIAF
jgi:hypothetical protein